MNSRVPDEDDIKKEQFPPPATSVNTTSINQLLRRHCREKLLVKPLHWTDRQLDLLECQFVSRRLSHWPTQPFSYYDAPLSPLSPSATSGDDLEGDDLEGDDLEGDDLEGDDLEGDDLEGDEYWARYGFHESKKPKWVVRTVVEEVFTRLRHNAMAVLLDYGILRFDFERQSLNFYFDGTRFRTRIPGLIFGLRRPRHLANPPKLPGENAVPLFPLVLWLDYGPHIRRPRQHTFSQPKRENAPVTAVHRIRLRQVTPLDSYRDPYIVAALIALAQAQKQWEDQNRPGMTGSQVFTTRLILRDSKNSKAMQLYMADVSAAFLDKLAHPHEYKTVTPLQVFHDEMRIRPKKYLRERLLQRMFLADTEGLQMDKRRGIKRKMSEDEGGVDILGREDRRSEKQ